MSGGRPDSETARRMGMVPYTAAPDAPRENAEDPWTAPPKANNKTSSNKASGYPTVNTTKSSGNNSVSSYNSNAAGTVNDTPNNRSSNEQLWANGSGGFNQGSAPSWPKSENGTPLNPNNSNFQSRQPGSTGAGAYILPPQPIDGRSGAPTMQHQQPQPQQYQRVSEGIPVAAAGNWQGNRSGNGFATAGQPIYQGQAGGQLTQGAPRGPMPKGDYVYYDGKGNQIPTEGGPNGPNGSGSERHHHHHYFYNQQQQQAGYPYDKNMEKRKKRRPGAAALAGALLACWVCTCCCHAPCGC